MAVSEVPKIKQLVAIDMNHRHEIWALTEDNEIWIADHYGSAKEVTFRKIPFSFPGYVKPKSAA